MADKFAAPFPGSARNRTLVGAAGCRHFRAVYRYDYGGLGAQDAVPALDWIQ